MLNRINLYALPSRNKKLNIVGIDENKVNLIDMSTEECSFYDQPLNYHHWTITSAWKYYKKILANENLNMDNTEAKIVNMFGKDEITYVPTIGRYRVYELVLKELREGGPEILYNLNKPNKFNDFKPIDDYHDMMIMRTAYIENLTHEKAESLLLIADSMSVGLVPVLAQQFSKILLVDVRNAVNLSRFNFSSFDRCIAIQVNDEEHSKYTQCNIDFINSLMI